MKQLGMVVVLLALATALGCDKAGGGGGILLAQGTKTITTGGEVAVVDVAVTEPGTLQGRITWTGAPTDMVATFLHIAPSDILGVVHSPSPLVATVAVTSARVAAGADWRFIAANSSGPDVSVSYTITFTPE
jgi:hypothetical protein